ncbi:MAG: LamG-like jellyroll fold domain-containing protein [Planctomycetota bacterium]
METDREGARPLLAPDDEPMWQFAIMGDRTGGPAEGIRVLARAVSEINLIEPDLIMTVGDLISGYNQRPMWLIQAAEFIQTMGRLSRPWYPVAGNHDVYWRGPGKPEGEHESNYEEHFGPLWYWFEHKDCAFITLYSDEGDPVTGKKSFTDRSCQKFSERQLDWLDGVLEKTAKLDKVFVFLHHPRWISNNYPGANWAEVHDRLVASGNVEAVFAGHIHRLHYGGNQDGIEYFTLATTGGHKSHEYPGAGWVHHWNLVTVRPSGVDMAVVPVGSFLDHRDFSPQRRLMTERLLRDPVAVFQNELDIVNLATEPRPLILTLRNPTKTNPIQLKVSCSSGEIDFPVREVLLGPEATRELSLQVNLDSAIMAGQRALPNIDVEVSFQDQNGQWLAVPSRRLVVPVDLSALSPRTESGGHLELKNPGDCVIVPANLVKVPQGPFSLEGWINVSDVDGRTPFLCKTNGSEFGIFVNDGVPEFMVHLDGKYYEATATSARIKTGQWHHVAGVYDGAEIRVYLDGQQVGEITASGKRTTNDLPLILGADPDGSGAPTDSITGLIDGVRLSKGARYQSDSFTPVLDPPVDSQVILQLPLDWQVAGFVAVEGGSPTSNKKARIHGGTSGVSSSATKK